VLEKHDIAIDETGASLACPDDVALEDLEMTDEERDIEAERRLRDIESVEGGEGGEVGVFDINHLGGHRYAGVLLVSPTREEQADNRSYSRRAHMCRMAVSRLKRYLA
jgi:hypothetical protein